MNLLGASRRCPRCGLAIGYDLPALKGRPSKARANGLGEERVFSASGPEGAIYGLHTYGLHTVDQPAALFYTHFQGEQGARQLMRLVVVGGQARKVGKTSVIAALIRGLSMFAWTAVKVSHHAGDAARQDAPSADELPPHLDLLLSEERDPTGDGDTSLYLAAGARRALWLRTRGNGLARALPVLLEALEGEEHVIIESNSLLSFLKPAVFLMVIDESRQDYKASARQFLACADAFVAVRPDRQPSARPATSQQMPDDKPVFWVSRGEWSNPGLCGFVGGRLASAGDQATAFGA